MVFNLFRNIVTVSLFLAGCSEQTGASVDSIVKAHIIDLMRDENLPAVSVAIVENNTRHLYHFGELPMGHAPNNRTFYDIGSLTKTHTGVILAQAVSDGKIALDAPISTYLPTIDASIFQRDGTTATIRHLATHLSGMPTDLACTEFDMAPDDRLDCFMAHDRKDLLARLQQMQLLDKPGSQYRYSNAGVRLLGHILEDIYGEPFERLLERLVFSQTGQVETRLRLSTQERKQWSQGAHTSGLPVPDASAYFNPAGGLKSTAPDMAAYMHFYLSEENTLAKRAMTLLAGKPDGLGRAYIWNTFRLETEGMLYHGGGTFGTSAWMSLYPREGLGVFLVTPYVAATTQEKLNLAANAIIDQLRNR